MSLNVLQVLLMMTAHPMLSWCAVVVNCTVVVNSAVVPKQVVLPQLCFNDEDAELWEEDPQEFVRKVRHMLGVVLPKAVRQLAP